MDIVLFILSILIILLIVAVALALIVILIVLFSPCTYIVEGDIHDTPWIKARGFWLLHLVSARVTYEDKLVYGVVRILWKTKRFSYDLTETKEEENQEDEAQKKKKESSNPIEKIKDLVEKIKIAYPRLKKIFTDDRNKQAVLRLKNELIYFVKILLPKKSRMHAEFSTGAPDTTGQFCGVIALFPVMYQRSWELRPDFAAEEPYFKGDFWARGRLYLYQIIGMILRIIFDKNCRRMYTMIDRLNKSIKKTNIQEGK